MCSPRMPSGSYPKRENDGEAHEGIGVEYCTWLRVRLQYTLQAYSLCISAVALRRRTSCSASAMACLFAQASRHVSLAHLLKFRWTSRYGEVVTHLARCMKTTQNAALLRVRNFLLTVGAKGGLGYPIRAMQARICFSLSSKLDNRARRYCFW